MNWDIYNHIHKLYFFPFLIIIIITFSNNKVDLSAPTLKQIYFPRLLKALK